MWSAAAAGVQGAQVYTVFRARQLELEDRQSRLQQELREKMAVDGNHFKSVVQAQKLMFEVQLNSVFLLLKTI